MEIVLHLGAPCTDEDRLLRVLVMNRPALAEAGILVAKPRRYRRPIFDALATGSPDVPDSVSGLVEEVLRELPEARRMVLSSAHFLGPLLLASEGDRLLPQAQARMEWLVRAFPGQPLHLMLAIRNPATILPAQAMAGDAPPGFAELLADADPPWMRWSDCVAALRAAAPDAGLTVWCNEDSPLIWADVLRAAADHPDDLNLVGLNDFPGTLMTAEGLSRMEGYLATHPPKSDAQWRRIAAAFLEKFALPDAVTMELDLPGWTEDMVRRATAAYDADATRIEAMPGVRFIRP